MGVRKGGSRLLGWIRLSLKSRECVSVDFGWTCVDKELMGIAIKVGPGPMNQGIFVKIKRDGPGQGEVSHYSSFSPFFLLIQYRNTK